MKKTLSILFLSFSFILRICSEQVSSQSVKIIETIKNNSIEYDIKRSTNPFKYVKYLKPIKIEPIPLNKTNKNSPIDTFVSIHSYCIQGKVWDEISSHFINPPDLIKYHTTKQKAFEDAKQKSINDIIEILGILFYEDKEIIIYSSKKESLLGIRKSAQYFIEINNQYFILMDDERKIKFLDELSQKYWEMDEIISDLVGMYGKLTITG